MNAWVVVWSIPFSPSNDYLMPGERYTRGAFTTRELANQFAKKLQEHGWKDRHGHRNPAKVEMLSEQDVRDDEALDSIPEWCFP